MYFSILFAMLMRLNGADEEEEGGSLGRRLLIIDGRNRSAIGVSLADIKKGLAKTSESATYQRVGARYSFAVAIKVR